MNKSRKITVAVLAVALCLMFGLSMADTVENKKETDFDYEQIKSHVEAISAVGPHSIVDKEENGAVLEYLISQLESYGVTEGDTTGQPAYLVQDYVVTTESFQNWYLSNLVVHIPANGANPTHEAVMVMSHYDSVPMGVGASDDANACAVMLEAVRYYLDKMENGATISNDLVFCFTNAEEYGLHGSKAFMEEFDGFDNLLKRIKFGINLEARGTAGTQIMFETSANNYNTIKLFAEVNEDLYTCSIATMIYDMMPNGTDFSNFKEFYQGVNMANIGGGENYHTQNDNVETLGDNYASQQAKIIGDLLEKLSNYDLDSLYEAEESAVFFSYLNIGTVVYNEQVAIVLGILGLIALVCNVILSRVYRKEKNLPKTVRGLVTIVAGLVVAAALSYGAYYLFQHISVLAGRIDSNIVGYIQFSNTAIMVGIGVLALGVTAVISGICSKLMKITKRDIVRAFAYIHVVLGIVLSFVLCEASYLFMISGLLLMMNELAITIFKNKNVAEYHLELLCTALYMPIVIPIISLAAAGLGLAMCYVYGILFVLALFAAGACMKPLWGGISLAAATVIFLCVSLTTPDPHATLMWNQGTGILSYDDALIYVVADDGACEYRICDLEAYNAVQKYAPDMEFTENGFYEASATPLDIGLQIRSHVAEGSLVVEKADEDALIYLTFTNATAESFTIDDGITTQTYEFGDEGEYYINIHSNCTVTLNDGTANVFYREVVRDYPMLVPEDYEQEEKLHFNLWMIGEFVLGFQSFG